MTDRRRSNGPAGGTAPPVFTRTLQHSTNLNSALRPYRSRGPKEPRKVYLKTGLTPSASGSAYFELEPSPSLNSKRTSLIAPASSLKLTCNVHGPRPLPRSAPFTPHLLLSTSIKFAPFASRQRRAYLRDSAERDLAVHLETALKGIIISDRWPKSGVDVVITVLEAEEDCWWADEAGQTDYSHGGNSGAGMISTLSGCITVASAAVADAGIDCIDLVSGGVAAIIHHPTTKNPKQRIGSKENKLLEYEMVIDPCPSEHNDMIAICVVGYLEARDEVTELWIKGCMSNQAGADVLDGLGVDNLMDGAIQAAQASRLVLIDAIKESTESKVQKSKEALSTNMVIKRAGKDGENMTG